MNWDNVLNERRQSLSPWYKTKEKPMREWRLERVSITVVILFWGIARLIFEHTTGCVPYATAAGRKREANASAIFFSPAKRTVAPKERLLNQAAEICVQYGLGEERILFIIGFRRYSPLGIPILYQGMPSFIQERRPSFADSRPLIIFMWWFVRIIFSGR